jgi:hypothetical protein
VTEWPQMLESISKVAGIKRSKVLKELELWSDFLVELSQTFLEQSNKLLITSFYERQPYNGIYVSDQPYYSYLRSVSIDQFQRWYQRGRRGVRFLTIHL